MLGVQSAAPAAIVVTPVTLERLADDFDAICVKPGKDDAAMKAAAEAYEEQHPAADHPSYSALRTRGGTTCFVFGRVTEDATAVDLGAVTAARFGRPIDTKHDKVARGELAWRVGSSAYQAQVSDQHGKRVALLSISYEKDHR